MKLIKTEYKDEYNSKNQNLTKIKKIFNNYNILLLLLLIINIIINNYLLIENKRNKKIIKEILDFKNSFDYKNNTLKNNYFPNNDKEMIGLYYPEFNFDKIKAGLKNFNIIDSLIDLVNQLEIKLIYLEKEINITKLISFYTSRKYYLNERNITYNENYLARLYEIINWITVHKSSQLKGIASDKYLACKYIKLKLGKNLCEHRIAVYNSLEELNYNELSKYGNIILKVSNSCFKKVFISNNTKIDNFKKKIKKFKKLLGFEHGILDIQPFHLYAKRKIVVERQFVPLTDLYEFKFFIINNKIKLIYLTYFLNKSKPVYFIYDTNYNFIFKNKKIDVNPLNITTNFKKDVLEKIKEYAINISKDFPNFIRVDLYIFHDKIYLSELTFTSFNGLPMDGEEKFVKDAIKDFSLIYDYY
jgi:hypothetical protein